MDLSSVSAAVLLDALLVAFILFSVIMGAVRGLIKSVRKIAALVITIVFVMMFKTPFSNTLSQTTAAERLYASVSERITPSFSQGISGGNLTYAKKSEIASELRLPPIVVSQVLDDHDAQALYEGTETALNTATDNIARSVTMMIMGFIAAVILFIFIKLLLFVIYHILVSLSKLPVIHGTNKLLGMFAGFLNSLFIIYIICGIISIIATDNVSVYNMIEETYIVKYFCNFNLLLRLFMRA